MRNNRSWNRRGMLFYRHFLNLISLIKHLSIILMLSSMSTWVNQYFLRVIYHGINIEVKFQG
jgi:hypothetical protein